MTGDRDLRGTVAAVAVLLVVTCWLFAPVVRGALVGEPRFFEWDVPEQYWPDQVYLCRSLHDGRLPSWNPYDRAGYPYFADPQAATWHPYSWLVCGLGGASPAPGWMTLRVLLGFLGAGLFGLLWLRRLGLPSGPALLGATVIETAPFMRHNWELNLTLGLAFLPLMLWAAEGLATRRRARDGALLALAVALCGWSGSPPALWQAGTFCCGYLAWRSVGELRGRARSELRALAVSLAVAGLLTAALLAVVLVPGLELASLSVQAGNDLASIAAGGLEPGDLAALLWPRPGNHLYLGLAPLLLALLGAARPPESGAPGRGFYAVAAVVAVSMTLGLTTPVFGLAWRLVPGVDMFRLPHRYEAWLGPAVGVLAGFGLVRLTSWRPAAAAAWVAPTLALLVLLDVGRALPPDRHTRGGEHPGLDTSALDRLPADAVSWRVFDEFGVSCRSGARLGWRDLRGYQDPLQLRSYERVIGSLREHPRLAEQHSVRFALTGPHFIHGWNRHFLPPPAELLAIHGARDLGGGVIELPEPLPTAWWVPLDRVERVADRPAALERLRSVAPAMVAILEDPNGPPSVSGGPAVDPRPVDRFELSPDRVTVELHAPGEGVVVINEAWYPGWKALVDGRPAEVLRANGFVRAVVVPAGARQVELAFRPAFGQATRALLLLGLLCAAALLLFPVIRRDPVPMGPARAGSSHTPRLEVRDGPSDSRPGSDDPGDRLHGGLHRRPADRWRGGRIRRRGARGGGPHGRRGDLAGVAGR